MLKLTVHHVGARSGSRGFPVLAQFEPDVVNVLYEADPDAVAQIKEYSGCQPSTLHVVPQCLGRSSGSVEFSINYDPYTSSVLEFDEKFGAFYQMQWGYCDYILQTVCTTMEKRVVAVDSFDNVLAEFSGKFAAPDFLSLDTEGSELDILCGAEKALKDSILAVFVEVSFLPLRRNQKLFGDIHDFLLERGFYLAKLNQHPDWSVGRGPIGLRGDGFLLTADALFLKRVDRLLPSSESNQTGAHLKLRKLAFISIVFNLFEYGLMCLENSPPGNILETDLGAEDARPAWYRFLLELEEACSRHPKFYPPTFDELYSFAQSKARFEPGSTRLCESTKGPEFRPKEVLKRVLSLWPPALAFSQKARLLSESFYQALRLRLGPNTEVEELLASYGLEDQVRCLKKRRLEIPAAGITNR